MDINWNQWGNLAIGLGIKLITAILIYVIGKWIADIVKNLTHTAFQKAKMDETLAIFLKNIIGALLMAFIVIAAISQLGIQTSSLVAIIGAAGLAIGLALQGSLANFAAGVLIILFKPFKVGDFIEAGGTIGSVQEIQIFCTILNHPDNRRIVIPNNAITGGNISNFTAIERRRIDLVFSVSYTDDLKVAKATLEKLCADDSRIMKDPAPTIAVMSLGDSSVNIVCRPHVLPTDYWAVHFDLVEKGKAALEAAGCSIPFPQSDVHLYEKK